MSKSKAARALALSDERSEHLSRNSGWFAVVYQAGQSRPESEFAGGESPPALIEQCWDELKSVLLEAGPIRNHLTRSPRQWVAFAVQCHGDQTDRAGDLDLFTVPLRTLLQRAIESGRKNSSSVTVEAIVYEERGRSPRHLLARVLLLDSLELARAYCKRMTGGQKSGETKRLGGDGRGTADRSLDRVARIKALLDEPPPASYESSRDAVKALDELTREEIAGRLAGPLNAKIQSMPQNDHDARRELASWLNAELRAQHLAIRCPNSGLPAIIIANKSGKSGNVSRFRMQVRRDDGALQRTWSGSVLPHVELMPDVVRAEPLAGWASRVGASRKQPGKTR